MRTLRLVVTALLALFLWPPGLKAGTLEEQLPGLYRLVDSVGGTESLARLEFPPMPVNTGGYRLLLTVLRPDGGYSVYAGRIDFLQLYVAVTLYRARNPFRMLNRPARQLTQPFANWAIEENPCQIELPPGPPSVLPYRCGNVDGQPLSAGKLIRLRS